MALTTTHSDQLARLQEENQCLRKAVDKLSILNELSQVISSTMSLHPVNESIVKRSVRAVNAGQGTITLVDETSPTAMKTLIRAQASSTQHQSFHLTQNIVGWMLIHKQALISNDLMSDPRFSGVKFDGNIRSLLCVPLLIKNQMIGLNGDGLKKKKYHQNYFPQQTEL